VAGFRLLIKPSAAKEIEAIGTRQDRKRIVGRIQSIAADPRPPGCEQLPGTANLFRIRQGEHRVIYTVDDRHRVVEVIKVGHRCEVYRRTT
jgi:mRNA interferase RelE/StbE